MFELNASNSFIQAIYLSLARICICMCWCVINTNVAELAIQNARNNQHFEINDNVQPIRCILVDFYFYLKYLKTKI